MCVCVHLGLWQYLELAENRIGDDGMAALASAVEGGAMPLLEEIGLGQNPGSKEPVQTYSVPSRAGSCAPPIACFALSRMALSHRRTIPASKSGRRTT